MKTFLIGVPWLLVVILLALHLFKSKQVADTKESEAAIKEIKSDRDSLIKVINLKTDTIEAVTHRMNTLEFQLGNSDRQAQILRKKYESIRFKTFDSDTARMAAWSKLFPSIRSR